MDSNPNKRTQELAVDLNTSQSVMWCHLKKIRKVSKLGVSFLQVLSKKNKKDCISIPTSLLSMKRNERFHKNILTVDKTWVFYNVKHKKQ